MAARRLRARADARAPVDARQSPGRLPRDPCRRHERKVDRDGDDRAAPALGRAHRRRDDLAARRELERADPAERRRRRLRGGGCPSSSASRSALGATQFEIVTAAASRGFRGRGGRRRRRRGRARRTLRRDERAAHARRAPDERRARAHGRPRRHARGDRDREARGRTRDAIVVLPDDTYAHLVPGSRDPASAARARQPRHSSATRSPRHRTSPCRVASSAATARSETARTIPTVRVTSSNSSTVTTTPSSPPSSPTRTSTRCSALLSRAGSRFVATTSSSARALPAADLAELARRHFDHVEVVDDPVAALARAHELGEPVLVTGSLYLLGDLAQAEQ